MSTRPDLPVTKQSHIGRNGNSIVSISSQQQPPNSPQTPNTNQTSALWNILSPSSTQLFVLLYLGLVVYYSSMAYFLIQFQDELEYPKMKDPLLVVSVLLFGVLLVLKYADLNKTGAFKFGTIEDFCIILGMMLFLSLAWTAVSPMTLIPNKWTFFGVILALCVVFFPWIAQVFFPLPQTSASALSPYDVPGMTTSSTSESMFSFVTKVYMSFYTSYAFLFTIILVALLLLYNNVKKFNVPNLDTWILWGTIATFVFGIKSLFLYRFAFSNTLLIFVFLALLSLLVFLSIQPAGISQTTLTVVYTLACVVFAVMLPSSPPQFMRLTFLVSVIATVFLGMLTQRLQWASVQTLFGIISLYLVIHFANSLQQLSSKITVLNASNSKTEGNLDMILEIYFIFWAIVSSLYFTDIGNKNMTSYQKEKQWGIICGVGLLPLMVRALIFFYIVILAGNRLYTKNNRIQTGMTSLTDGFCIGMLFTLVGVLLMVVYFLGKTYGNHVNYAIVCMSILFMVFSFWMMVYNVKNVSMIFLFLLILLLPVGFGSLFQHTGWRVFVGFLLLVLWCGLSIYFWTNTNLSMANLLNRNVLVIGISGLLLYLVFYYAYLTFTSKASFSEKFSQILLILMFGYLFLQIFKQTKMGESPIAKFVVSVMEYIPCLYDNLVTSILSIEPDKTWKEDFSYHQLGTKIITVLVLGVVGYYFYPKLQAMLQQRTHTPGFVLVGETPISTQGLHLLLTYEELTKTVDKPLYNYGISFDLYVEPSGGGNDTFHTIVSFVGNLFVQYNPQQNQLYIYALKADGSETAPEVVLYRYNHFPLQKWVKLEINYVAGIYDVFVEKKIKTSNAVVAYNSAENIYVGEEGSTVVGKVRNFMYYPKPLSKKEIQATK